MDNGSMILLLYDPPIVLLSSVRTVAYLIKAKVFNNVKHL